ncbi:MULTISPECIES: bifunctional diguanylate cyclase/phosphodiesterase [Cellvibrio]|uniref:Diguanylate cyclase (GGDEF)-like protein n=1 Tax=Cellvibrio fibrivorans TaxID=126350 RepID=A0ABU1V0F4_9GAMM|nr:EAL domain-containing protein [Cellvibrio fibrivorans]MDR7090927.1 diguanylate cyclase (GGDEF)-like protein [Cellvibrio fibrivorans]
MSLIKQLWIGIIVLLLLVLAGNFVISTITAKTYLQEQLRLKNIDNANSLALSISQMPDKDPVTLELLITAQFDAGHYEYIIFQDADEKPIVARNFDDTKPENNAVPKWFAERVKFNVAPGIAQVQDGWQQAGTLVVKSHSRYALEALWQNTRDLLDWFICATLLSGLIGSFILKYISRPLDLVVNQAEAIGERRFIISEEPKTKEFQRLVRAMNTLSQGVKQMLDKEARQLELLRRESQTDSLTGLANRTHFLNLLDTQLTREDAQERGIIVLARAMNLNELNNQLGHQQVDQLLRAIAGVFSDLQDKYPNSYAGRLNGSDFTLLIPTDTPIDILSADVSQKLNFQLIAGGFDKIALPLALCSFNSSDKRNELLHKLDGALAQAELKGNRAVIALADDQLDYVQHNLTEWRNAITESLSTQGIALAKFPVRNTNGDLLHNETAVRLELDGELKPAGYFMPWAVRLGLMPDVDLAVLKLALTQLGRSPGPLAINISAAALCSANFREQVLALLLNESQQAKHLWIEFPEICMLRHLEELRAFSTRLRSLGCRVGLEHVGLEFTQFGNLQSMGLGYLKIDSAIIRDIHNNLSSQTFVQSLCTLGHSLGIVMIAEGVLSDAEQQTLMKIGVDGLTGPNIT